MDRTSFQMTDDTTMHRMNLTESSGVGRKYAVGWSCGAADVMGAAKPVCRACVSEFLLNVH